MKGWNRCDRCSALGRLAMLSAYRRSFTLRTAQAGAPRRRAATVDGRWPQGM
eukprot:CAMPEP_0113967420 /NCGR_PEP_ID=MMETSP0011_2-20120614/8920_1 /TAXON_ID=101924 /ORGANISM="Rhodosorus marinus" /LENGTH=51 /DNA_ID=CAMNT_0000980301 /DNA_START=57 /DNA_END=212 /DNA_ORIENTATION=- /assembly_acc=CAM_ASM_000156